MADTFSEIACGELSILTGDHGFHVAAEDQQHVRLESEVVAVEVWHDPRGEVAVSVCRLDRTDPYAEWTYTGMVGSASVARVLEIGIEQMTSDPAILTGEPGFYDQLAAENRRLSEVWTAYYSGKGPRPTASSRSSSADIR